jgi:hypothetical protein
MALLCSRNAKRLSSCRELVDTHTRMQGGVSMFHCDGYGYSWFSIGVATCQTWVHLVLSRGSELVRLGGKCRQR